MGGVVWFRFRLRCTDHFLSSSDDWGMRMGETQNRDHVRITYLNRFPIAGLFQRNWSELNTIALYISRKTEDPEGDWWELWDENNKLPYYYNTLSGTTEWFRPENKTIIPLMKIQVRNICPFWLTYNSHFISSFLFSFFRSKIQPLVNECPIYFRRKTTFLCC